MQVKRKNLSKFLISGSCFLIERIFFCLYFTIFPDDNYNPDNFGKAGFFLKLRRHK